MSVCARCGAQFQCAVADGGAAPCWCMAAPSGLPLPDSPDATCWCPLCLKEQLAAAAVNIGSDTTHD